MTQNKVDTPDKVITHPADTAQPNTIYVHTNFPADTIYPARILKSGGVYHEDEVDAKSTGYLWKALFKSPTGYYYVKDTKLTLSKEYDAVLDEEGGKTGWNVLTNAKDSAVLLISGLDYLVDGDVLEAKLHKEGVLPGEYEDFVFNGIQYRLYATGIKQPAAPKSAEYRVSNYKLFLKATIKGIVYDQLLLSVTDFDGTFTRILFAGDIDNDGLLDMIIDTTSDYNVEVPTLYLSRPAIKRQLLKVVGMHTYVGC